MYHETVGASRDINTRFPLVKKDSNFHLISAIVMGNTIHSLQLASMIKVVVIVPAFVKHRIHLILDNEDVVAV